MPPCVKVDIKSKGYAIITMQKEPVNSLDHAMWSELQQAFTELEANPAIKGVIFASGLQREVFSAGNDLSELHPDKTSSDQYKRFWDHSNKFLVQIFKSRLATVAAIRGACPAGGCIIAMCCDHRLMTPQGSIGLNEVVLGIPVPKYWALLLARLIGSKEAEKVLCTGKMLTPIQAKKVGWVDDIVEKESLLPSAEALMLQLVQFPHLSASLTKLSLREDFSKQWEAYLENEAMGGWQILTRPETKKVLGAVMQRLSSKSSPASKL